MHMKFLALATGVALLAATGAASAATVTNDLNLRAGPGTDYPVIDTMPGGSHVSIRNCTGSWCRVNFRGQSGWASAGYLGGSRTTTVYRSAPAYSYAYAEPSYSYFAPDYGYWGPGLGYAYAPGVSFGIGFGGGGWHHGWRHGGWGGHHWHH